MTKPTGGFELREHTADLALYVWGRDLPELFARAAKGLYAAMGNLVLIDEPSPEPLSLNLSAPDRVELLWDLA